MKNIESYKKHILFIVSGLFILINTLFITQEIYYFIFFPLVLAVLYLLFFSLDKFLLLIVFLTPLSFEIESYDYNIGVALPTEPLMFGVLLLLILKILSSNKLFDKAFLNHPVTIAVFFSLLWMLITSITSTHPVVSFKYLTARLWFLASFFFFGILLFKKYNNIKYFFWAFGIAMAAIITYISIMHAQYNFERQPGTWIVKPFFNDHTAYAAVIALFMPLTITQIFNTRLSSIQRFISFFILIVLIAGILFSYSRAGWLSLACAFGVFLILRLKISYKVVLSGVLVLFGILYLFQADIIMKLEKNKQDSSGKYAEHIRSISNISTDASNLERINRWAAAIRMFKEKPILGWGPGTYQFVYAPFQYSKEKTVISTNAGDMGNAHSEYIGPLSESGVLGMLSFMAIALFVFITGVKVYKKALNKEIKLIALGALLGLTTYFAHGIMNNFLDTDKASVPFWALTSIIVALDIYHKDKIEPSQKEE